MASAEITAVSALSDAGIPEEIADNIVNTKEHLEYLDRIKDTKIEITYLHNLYKAYKKIGSSWCLNVFWDVERSVGVLVSNAEFINETWFKENWSFLFKDLLSEIRFNFDEYVRSRTRSADGFDDFAISQMKNIKNKIIHPLTEMKKTTEASARRSRMVGSVSV